MSSDEDEGWSSDEDRDEEPEAIPEDLLAYLEGQVAEPPAAIGSPADNIDILARDYPHLLGRYWALLRRTLLDQQLLELIIHGLSIQAPGVTERDLGSFLARGVWPSQASRKVMIKLNIGLGILVRYGWQPTLDDRLALTLWGRVPIMQQLGGWTGLDLVNAASADGEESEAAALYLLHHLPQAELTEAFQHYLGWHAVSSRKARLLQEILGPYRKLLQPADLPNVIRQSIGQPELALMFGLVARSGIARLEPSEVARLEAIKAPWADWLLYLFDRTRVPSLPTALQAAVGLNLARYIMKAIWAHDVPKC